MDGWMMLGIYKIFAREIPINLQTFANWTLLIPLIPAMVHLYKWWFLKHF